jgi:hypothetical protein
MFDTEIVNLIEVNNPQQCACVTYTKKQFETWGTGTYDEWQAKFKEAKRDCKAYGVTFVTIPFDPKDYKQFLGNRPDTGNERARWASLKHQPLHHVSKQGYDKTLGLKLTKDSVGFALVYTEKDSK